MESRGRGERGERGSGRGRGPFQGARGGRFGSDGSRGGFNGGRGGFNGGRGGFNDGRGGFIGGRNGSDGVRGGFSGGRNWSDGGRDGFSGGRSRSHGGRDGYRGGRGGFDNGGRNDFNGGRGAGNQQFEYQSQLQVQFGTMSVVGEGSSSGGQQQFSGDNYAAKLSQPSHPTTDRGLVPKTQLLKLSDGASLSSDNGGMVPVTRPDKGGTKKIFSVNILVNHFPVRFNPESIIRHYDIDVKPVQQSTQGRLVKISKANLSMIMDKLFSQHPNFPQEMTAFDGEKNIFSAVSLPVGIYKVVFSPEEGMKCLNYEFSVTLVNELRLHKLKDYLTGNLLQLPRDVLQGMDVVMKENPRKHMVGIGKSFHPIDPTNSPLSRGLLASQGFQHSLKPTSQGMALCLDYSVLAVRKRTSVLEFLREHINLQVVDSRHFQIRKRDIETALKGLKVTVTHRLTKQKYIISGLTEYNARDISFNKEDPANQESKKSVRLVDYFKEKYPDNHIKHEDIPCLCLGKGKRNNYVPIEFCVLVEGQRFPKDNLDRDSALLLKDLSLASPHIRREKICGLLQEDHGPTGGVTSKKFEIEVEKQMTQVQGRVIAPPTLKLRSPRGEMTAVDVDNSCQWNLVNRSLVEGKSLKHWAVLDFSYRERATDRLNEYFISKLVARCEKLGIQIEPHPTIERSDMGKLQRSESVADLLERLVSGAKKSGKNLQLILCVMTRKDHGYNYIKWVSETKIGVVTQCCLSKMANKMQDQYLANLGMKINAKLGGSNVELFNKLPSFGKDEDRVMLIGADVNHPRPLDASSPSIAAVVASMNWPAASKYVPRISQQRPRMEEIDGFGRMCLELVKCYEKLNGAKPQRLVIFRDGVSEAQFDMVLNKELLDLLLVMKAANYRPTITLIVARKRHQTRLFPQTPRDGGSKGNIYPGTVVDTTIIHPREFDFYLCSHFGSIGTSKPTHYHVLWDENGFSSDDLQKFIYDLCFTFARCCKPVSLVPPVYYADLLAYRGRLYFEAQLEKQSCSSSVASSSSTCASWSEIALHSDIENVMYFI